MFEWINNNMDKYCLQLFQSEITGWENQQTTISDVIEVKTGVYLHKT